MKEGLPNFSKLALKELQFKKEADKMSYKDLSDYLINEVWGDKKHKQFGTKRCAVLDRVINELIKLENKKF